MDSLQDAQRALDANDRRLAELGIAAGAGGALNLSGEEAGVVAGPEQDTSRVTAEGADAPASPDDSGNRDRSYASPEPSVATDSLTSESQPESRCARICALAEFSCALSQQVCELAEGHPDERRYGEVCERAQAQCEAASSACDACQ